MEHYGYYPNTDLQKVKPMQTADLSPLANSMPEKVDMTPLEEKARGLKNVNQNAGSFNFDMNKASMASAAIGAVGGAMDTQNGYGPGEIDNTNYGMNATKDAVGAAIPIAGIFRGIEKGVVGIAGSTSGQEGKEISQAMFSPSDTIAKIIKSDNMDSKEKTNAYIATFLNPVLAGKMISSARKKGEMEMAKEAMKESDDKIKLDRKMSYLALKGEKVTEAEKANVAKQMKFIKE